MVGEGQKKNQGQKTTNQDPKTKNPKQKLQNLEPTTQVTPKNSQDLFGVLVEIKNELGKVKIKQETCKDDVCDVMVAKMSDFKQSLGTEIKK